jgi:urease accessory protein UreE
VAISGDTGIEGDRITSNGQVKVTLSLANNLILIDGELLEVSANGATWVNATPEPFTVLPNKVPDNLTCMAYFVLLFSPEVKGMDNCR